MNKNREELTERRARMVQKAFNMMDKNGSGKIEINDISKKIGLEVTLNSRNLRRFNEP